MKYKRLICMQTITNIKVHLSILKFYLKVRKQISWISWKLVYNMYKVWTKYRNLFKKQKVVDFVNNLSFNLYIILFAYHIAVTSEK